MVLIVIRVENQPVESGRLDTFSANLALRKKRPPMHSCVGNSLHMMMGAVVYVKRPLLATKNAGQVFNLFGQDKIQSYKDARARRVDVTE